MRDSPDESCSGSQSFKHLLKHFLICHYSLRSKLSKLEGVGLLTNMSSSPLSSRLQKVFGPVPLIRVCLQ